MQITPNRRLAIYLNKKQRSHFQRPVYALQDWVECLGEQHLKSQQVSSPEYLTAYEEELLWEKIIKASPAGQNLVNPRAIANLAKGAHDLIQQWEIKTFDRFSETEESQAFFEWRLEYQKILAKHHWIDQVSVLSVITENLHNIFNVNIFSDSQDLNTVPRLPQEIECVGFSEYTSQQHNFFESLKNLGVSVSKKNLSQTPKAVIRAPFLTAEEELYQALRHAQCWLQENPKAQIGIVILDLEQRRSEVEAMLQRLLPRNSFNVAAPIPFAKHPIIAAALLGLSLIQYEIPLEQISRFLRCPFFLGGIEEQTARASFDVLLHQLKHSSYSLESLITLLKSELPEGTDLLLQTLQKLVGLRNKFKPKQTTSLWIENIQEWLNALGWGQGRILDEEEKCVQAEWQPLLDSYQSLGKILGSHRFSQALFHIETLAYKKAFTPPVPNANIQVLGLLEALGLPFDYLWCLGFSDNVWPSSPAPNPFIPLSLQIALNLPRSHAVRELQKAKDFTTLLSQGAKNMVVFSYPTTILDRHLRVSPLLKFLPEQKMTLNTFESQVVNESKFAAIRGGTVGTFAVEAAVSTSTAETLVLREKPLIVPPKKQLQGSLKALMLQAQCPFKAFATLRLTAELLQKPTKRLTKAERGEMIHEILYLFWKETQSQTNLLALSKTMLDNRLTTIINNVLENFQKRFPKRLTPRYKKLEKFRLKDLLLRFIEIEKSRPPFVVKAQELKTHCQVGPLEFSLRIDRIDALENGQELLIDYKTGQTQTQSWFKNPPEDPQLPLYSIARDPNPIGISLAVLRSNDLKYQGIAKEELSIPGIKPVAKQRTMITDQPELSWEALCESWYQGIKTLSCDFAAGVATVAPIAGNQTCRTCHLHSLCRKGQV